MYGIILLLNFKKFFKFVSSLNLDLTTAQSHFKLLYMYQEN